MVYAVHGSKGGSSVVDESLFLPAPSVQKSTGVVRVKRRKPTKAQQIERGKLRNDSVKMQRDFVETTPKYEVEFKPVAIAQKAPVPVRQSVASKVNEIGTAFKKAEHDAMVSEQRQVAAGLKSEEKAKSDFAKFAVVNKIKENEAKSNAVEIIRMEAAHKNSAYLDGVWEKGQQKVHKIMAEILTHQNRIREVIGSTQQTKYSNEKYAPKVAAMIIGEAKRAINNLYARMQKQVVENRIEIVQAKVKAGMLTQDVANRQKEMIRQRTREQLENNTKTSYSGFNIQVVDQDGPISPEKLNDLIRQARDYDSNFKTDGSSGVDIKIHDAIIKGLKFLELLKSKMMVNIEGAPTKQINLDAVMDKISKGGKFKFPEPPGIKTYRGRPAVHHKPKFPPKKGISAESVPSETVNQTMVLKKGNDNQRMEMLRFTFERLKNISDALKLSAQPRIQMAETEYRAYERSGRPEFAKNSLTKFADAVSAGAKGVGKNVNGKLLAQLQSI